MTAPAWVSNGMEFVIGDHARRRMLERNVSEELVTRCMSEPEAIEPDPTGDGLLYILSIFHRGLFRKLICAVDDSRTPNRVITVIVEDDH